MVCKPRCQNTWLLEAEKPWAEHLNIRLRVLYISFLRGTLDASVLWGYLRLPKLGDNLLKLWLAWVPFEAFLGSFCLFTLFIIEIWMQCVVLLSAFQLFSTTLARSLIFECCEPVSLNHILEKLLAQFGFIMLAVPR